MVKATLRFDKAGTVDVEYPVMAIGASAPGAAAGGGSGRLPFCGVCEDMEERPDVVEQCAKDRYASDEVIHGGAYLPEAGRT